MGLQFGPVVPGQRDLRPVLQNQFAGQKGPDKFHVHHKAALGPEELVAVQLLKEGVQRSIGLELLLGRVDDAQLVEDLDIGDLGGGDGDAAVAGLDMQDRPGVGAQAGEAAVHGLPHRSLFDGFQQIVDGPQAEGLDGVLPAGGDEDHLGFPAQPPDGLRSQKSVQINIHKDDGKFLRRGQKRLAAGEAGEREVHAVFGFVCPKKALQQIELPFFIVAQGDLQGAHILSRGGSFVLS